MLVFSNEGEISLDAMTTFGVNAKDNDNPIGYFGTGLKYAIARILALGGELQVWSGTSCYEFRKRESEIRGKKFEMIDLYCDGQADLPPRMRFIQTLGFTTDLGKNWEPWMVLRELWCNTMDEAGSVSYISDKGLQSLSPGEAGLTVIKVTCRQVEEAWHNRQEYILDTLPVHKLSLVNLMGYGPPTERVYYKGIAAHKQTSDKRWAWTWSIARDMKLTEDRTFASEYGMTSAIMMSLQNCADPGLIGDFLALPEGCLEHELHLQPFLSDEQEGVFNSVLLRMYKAHGAKWHESLCRQHHKAKKALMGDEYPPAKLSPIASNTIAIAVKFLADCGLMPDQLHPIIVTDALPDNILGLAAKSNIYLSVRLFDRGVKEVACCIYEEYVHLHYGHRDNCRAMQTFLFERLMTMAEFAICQGVPLGDLPAPQENFHAGHSGTEGGDPLDTDLPF